MVDWNDKEQVKKGNVGEKIIKLFLEKKGFIIYKPETEDKHAFDILAVKNKDLIIIAEVKSYPRRNYYEDTGLNLEHYQEYKNIINKYNLPIFLFFVDEMKGEIYGNWLTKLELPYKINKLTYPLIQKGSTGDRIYFPLCHMITIDKLTNDEIKALKKHSTRKYEYLNDP